MEPENEPRELEIPFVPFEFWGSILGFSKGSVVIFLTIDRKMLADDVVLVFRKRYLQFEM